jgi:hypothetical protein
MHAKLRSDPGAMPATVLGWSDWLIDFFRDDPASFDALLGEEAGVVAYVARGRKQGGPLTAAQFETLSAGLRSWLTGRPLSEIETALGVAPERLGCCPRARDLVLKLANRTLYLIAGALAELATAVKAETPASPAEPAVLETLAACIRGGYDTPDKLANRRSGRACASTRSSRRLSERRWCSVGGTTPTFTRTCSCEPPSLNGARNVKRLVPTP